MISFVWSLSFLWIIPIVGWHHFVNDGVRTVRGDTCDTEYAQNTALKITTAILNYYLPLAVMYALYTKIFVEIRHRSELEIGRRVDLNYLKRQAGPLLRAPPPSPLQQSRVDQSTKPIDYGRARSELASRSSDPTAAAGTSRTSCCGSYERRLSASETDQHCHQRVRNGFCSTSSHMHVNAADINADSDDILSLLHANRNEQQSSAPNGSDVRSRRLFKTTRNRTRDASLSLAPPGSERRQLTTCWYCRRRKAISCSNKDDDGCKVGNDDRSRRTREPERRVGVGMSIPIAGRIREVCDQRTYSEKNPVRLMRFQKQCNIAPSDGWDTCGHSRTIGGVNVGSIDGGGADRNQTSDVWMTDLQLRHQTTRSLDVLTSTGTEGFRRNSPMATPGVRRMWPLNHSKSSRVVCTGNGTMRISGERRAEMQAGREGGWLRGGEGGEAGVGGEWPNACMGAAGRQSRRHLISGGHGSALSKEIKAARQLGVIMGVFTVCFLPYFVCFMVIAFCETCVDARLMTAVTWIGYLNSALNPFIYPLCNLKFRIQFRKMLSFHSNGGSCCCCWTGREVERGSAFGGQSFWSSSSGKMYSSKRQLRRTQSLLILKSQRPIDYHLTHI